MALKGNFPCLGICWDRGFDLGITIKKKLTSLVIDKELLQNVTFHPVHIDGLTPSSFIPFCSFAEDAISVGREHEGFGIPVCDIFEKKIHNDQLCYETDLEKFKDENNIYKQLEIGLVLILDYNEDRQLDAAWRKKNKHEHFNDRKGKFFNHNGDNEAHIYFDSLSQI